MTSTISLFFWFVRAAVLPAALALTFIACGDAQPTGAPAAVAADGESTEPSADARSGAADESPTELPLPPVAVEKADNAAPAIPVPSLAPDGFQAAVDAGLAALRAGNADEAVARFTAAAALRPEDARIQRMLGNALARRGDLEEALVRLQSSRRLDDTVAGTQYETAQVAANLNNLDLAESAARRAMELAPENLRAADLLATVLHNRKDFAAMTTVMEPLVAATPERAQSHYLLGLAYFGEGRLPDARKELEEAIRLDPNHALAHRDLGGTLQRLGDAEGAARSRQMFESLTGRRNEP